MDGHIIPVVKVAKYLGVQLDTRRSYRRHIEAVAGNTKAMVNALDRIMPNIGGPGSSKRRLLMSAAMSKLLHSSTAWDKNGLIIAHNRAALLRPQRQVALKIARCYGTLSEPAALMLAETLPADFLIGNIGCISIHLLENSVVCKARIKSEERANTLIE